MNAETSTPFLSEEEHLEVRYAPWFGILCLVGGLVNVVLSVLLMAMSGEFNTSIITGALLTALGVLYLTRTYFVVAPNRITLYNLLGSAVKRYVYASPSELRLDGNKLYIDAIDNSAAKTAKPQKVKVAKWMTNSTDWQRLKSLISQA